MDNINSIFEDFYDRQGSIPTPNQLNAFFDTSLIAENHVKTIFKKYVLPTHFSGKRRVKIEFEVPVNRLMKNRWEILVKIIHILEESGYIVDPFSPPFSNSFGGIIIKWSNENEQPD